MTEVTEKFEKTECECDNHLIEEARYLIDIYQASQHEMPAAMYMNQDQIKRIEQVLADVDSQWGIGIGIPASSLFHCRVEIHKSTRMAALTRDERGLTKIIKCPFCYGPMVHHTPRNLLGSNAPPTQYWCEYCDLTWPSDTQIKREIKHSKKVLQETLSELNMGGSQNE